MLYKINKFNYLIFYWLKNIVYNFVHLPIYRNSEIKVADSFVKTSTLLADYLIPSTDSSVSSDVGFD